MMGSASTPADELASNALQTAARKFGAAYLTFQPVDLAGLHAAAIAYAEAVDDVRHARRTRRK